MDLLGLPLHPLVVHAAVVFVPLAAGALLGMLVVPRWRRVYDSAVLVLLVLAAGAAAAAAATGEQLAEQIGSPGKHEQWGELLPWAAGALCLVGGAWLLWERRRRTSAEASASGVSDRRSGEGRVAATALTGLVALTAGAAVVLTLVTGHSGASATWGGRGAYAVPAASAGVGTFTLSEVAAHADTSSCWSVINGTVYDLTSWIGSHPGGESAIRDLCGTDGSDDFTRRHARTQEAHEVLATLAIGTLAR